MMNSSKPESLQLCISESKAATALGISPRALGKLRQQGRVPHLKLGARIVYSVDVLRAFVVENSRSLAAPQVPEPNETGLAMLRPKSEISLPALPAGGEHAE
jgi:hypothetical protein